MRPQRHQQYPAVPCDLAASPAVPRDFAAFPLSAYIILRSHPSRVPESEVSKHCLTYPRSSKAVSNAYSGGLEYQRIDMGSNIQKSMHWIVRLPLRLEPDSDGGRWLKGIRDVQSEIDLLASPHPEKPEVIRCVRGFVAWKISGSVPEANLPSQREQASRW